jgi:hypothetical protein
MTAITNNRRHWLKAVPLVIVPVVFLASGPWLKATMGSAMTTWVSGGVAIFVMGYAWYLSICLQRAQDEVQKAGADFATKWGVMAGQITFFVLLALPPFQNLVGDLVNQPRGKVLLGMTIGAVGVVLLQAVGTVVASMLWWKSHRDPA